MFNKIFNFRKQNAAKQGIKFIIIEKFESIEVNEPQYLCLGIIENKLAKLIEINSTDFIKKRYVFSTTEDNQDQIILNLYRGSNEDQKSSTYLGQFQVVDIPKLPAEVPKIEVSFECNDGIIKMDAKDLNANEYLDIIRK